MDHITINGIDEGDLTGGEGQYHASMSFYAQNVKDLISVANAEKRCGNFSRALQLYKIGARKGLSKFMTSHNIAVTYVQMDYSLFSSCAIL